MTASILSLATAVPSYVVDQEQFAKTLTKTLALSEDRSKKIKRLFQQTKIHRRHSVIPDYERNPLGGALYSEFFPQQLPGSYKRNQLYKREAPKLALEAARKALKNWGGDPSAITHVISVSCTGMMAPGIEFILIESLGLNRNAARLGINFMGCFGAFQGLDTARAFAAADPNSRILLVCTELCSLHMQPTDEMGTLISNSLFADGAAAVVVGNEPTQAESAIWTVIRKSSTALQDSRDEMSWEMGDDGCIMVLTDRVPKEVELSLKQFVSHMLDDEITEEECEWLVHPGGKAILQAVSRVFDLNSEKDLKPSWDVLRDFGNMSSATFLFVLERAAKEKPYGIGIGFGPGLSLEGIILKNAKA